MLAEWITAAAGLALMVVTWGLFLAWHGRRPAAGAAAQVRRVRVDGGYRPAEVHVRAGIPSRLIFRREDAARCSERVVFPDFGLNVTLPSFEDVAVDLPASGPGEHEFTCQMRMLHGTLVVDQERGTGGHPASPEEEEA
jgi:plastocyanin domain-containing protein